MMVVSSTDGLTPEWFTRALGSFGSAVTEVQIDRVGGGAMCQMVRATLTWEGHHFVARTTGLQASSRLMSIVGANALLEIAPGTETLAQGTMVQALLLANL